MNEKVKTNYSLADIQAIRRLVIKRAKATFDHMGEIDKYLDNQSDEEHKQIIITSFVVAFDNFVNLLTSNVHILSYRHNKNSANLVSDSTKEEELLLSIGKLGTQIDTVNKITAFRKKLLDDIKNFLEGV